MLREPVRGYAGMQSSRQAIRRKACDCGADAIKRGCPSNVALGVVDLDREPAQFSERPGCESCGIDRQDERRSSGGSFGVEDRFRRAQIDDDISLASGWEWSHQS